MNIRILALSSLLALSAAMPALAEDAKPADKPAPTAEADAHKQAAAKALLTVRPDEVVVGKEEAPVTIIEYASMSCPHCADFYGKVYPKLKSELIDTGKVRFVFRHFPLNVTALKGGMLAECVPERSHEFLKVLFDQQSKWAYTPSYETPLATIASVGGIGREQFDACMKNSATETKLIESRKQASEVLGVESTPTFFINGTKVVGEKKYEDFKALVDEAAKKK